MTQILWLNTEFVLQDEIYPWQQFYVSGLNRYNIISNISSLVFVAFSLTELLFPGDPQRNVVMWMDHRATEQADRITKNGHRVLSRVGGVMSPEMQPPKLLWLKEVRGEQGHHWSLHVLLLLFVLAVQQIPGGLLLFVFYYCFSLSIFVIQLLLLFSHTLSFTHSESKGELLEQSQSLFWSSRLLVLEGIRLFNEVSCRWCYGDLHTYVCLIKKGGRFEKDHH